MALSSYVKQTETAVNNTEVAITLESNVTRLRFSSPVDFELRIATAAAGTYCAKEDHILIENALGWRGATVYLWSAGNGNIHTTQELGVLG